MLCGAKEFDELVLRREDKKPLREVKEKLGRVRSKGKVTNKAFQLLQVPSSSRGFARFPPDLHLLWPPLLQVAFGRIRLESFAGKASYSLKMDVSPSPQPPPSEAPLAPHSMTTFSRPVVHGR